MHNTSELKRQYEAAKSKQENAALAARLAREAYNAGIIRDKEAELAKDGIFVGAMVDAIWCGKRKGTYYLHSISVGKWSFAASINLAKVKNDGTAYRDTTYVSFDALVPAKPQHSPTP